jgi:hypothetical protein
MVATEMEGEDLMYIPLADGDSLFSVLPENLVAAHIVPGAISQDLARFCMTSRHARRLEPYFARMVAAIQHGISKEMGVSEDNYSTLSSIYRTLDSVQDRTSFEFTRPFMAVLLKGERREGDRRRAPEFMLVDVGGGRTGYRTVAACPPGRGDSWRLLVPLRRGRYKLEVSGWRNPHHGILDISLDFQAISPPEGLDWYADTSTAPYLFPPMNFEVQSTGTHVLRGEVNRCNYQALGAKYWICLDHLRITPADEVAEPSKLQVPKVPVRSAGRDVSRERSSRLHGAAHVAAALARKGRRIGTVTSNLFRRAMGKIATVELLLHRVCPCRRQSRSVV